MRLLVVEDYQPLRDALNKGLREAGYAVDSTADGNEGLWYALGNDYDVIILDLMLPGLGGVEILKQLRAKGRDTHVLILTAKDTVRDRVAGLDLGADDYLVKPFAFAELLARVRALLRRTYDEKAPCLRVANLRIEQATRRVFRGKERVELPPQGVRSAGVPGDACRPGGFAHRHLGAYLRIRLDGLEQCRRCLYRLSA